MSRVSRQQVSQVSTVTRETDAMEKEEKLDGDANHSNLDISEQEIDFPWVPVQNNDNEFDADAVPFQPRFLHQEPISIHLV